ncbi:MAG: nitrous oxide reductase family maturation protein NosD [Chlorobi bacterium]|nr:nitrous oxide reductase family maturation protein NosD [Chlorobiota bacterium]MCI0716418.1 nitrous oxide reductase family maturation protein NosD [Chlorobiota bacterium]
MKNISKISKFFIASCLFITSHLGFGKDIIVTEGNSIKNAVESSSEGDRIMVSSGIYFESGIIITKKIELIGKDYPIVDGGSIGEIFTVKASGVVIKGFVVKNSGFSSLKDFAAIRVENSINCIIQDNKLINNYFGIYLAGANDCKVFNNEIISNAVKESASGNGIHLWKCDNILIKNNSVSGHRDGIYFEFVTHSKISENFSFNNIRYGLHFMFSNWDDYEYNVFSTNGAGVAVMYTKYVKMINNRFENNWGRPNSYGLLLKDISESFIFKNTFHKNTVGIFAEGVSKVNIEYNLFTENGYAAKILGNCTEDTIKANNFISNSFDISTNSSRNSNLFYGNYWDKNKGYDLNKDGFSDAPYRPVSMFSMMVEQTPESIFLLRSFLVNLLDLAEKVMPVIIPESLIDLNPRMEPVI